MDTQRNANDAHVEIHDWVPTGHETLACQFPGCGLDPLGDRAAWLAAHAGPNMDFQERFGRAFSDYWRGSPAVDGDAQRWQAIARRLYTVLKGATYETKPRDFGYEVGHRLYAHHRLGDICLTCSALEAFESVPQIIDDDFSAWQDEGGEG